MNSSRHLPPARTIRTPLWVAAAAALLFGSATPATAHTDEGCDAFTWDLTTALAAMRTPGTALHAGTDPAKLPPRIDIGKHYSLTLAPQPDIHFAHPPARPPRADKPTAGLVSFTVPTAGRYRIGLSSSHWIDVLDGATVIDSLDHQGRAGCALLHKVVEFELPAGRPLTLQISGQEAATIELIVSPA
ncbi:MAG TPA: hypothetical protein VMF52_11130 [Steroidobacteraceae bacterium]|nr:hypothetical protein [Steroidobacteraceae bacterium]